MAGTRALSKANTEKLGYIYALEAPLRSLLTQLQESIGRNEYRIIIADDTSGRVPALILRGVINRGREARGLPKLPIVFLPGGGGRPQRRKAALADDVFAERTPLVQRLAGCSGGAPAGRALLVTDNVSSGKSVGQLAQNLAGLGLGVDIAAIGSNCSRWSYTVEEVRDKVLSKSPEGTRFFLGGAEWSAIDGCHELSGVEKFVARPVLRSLEARGCVVAARRAGAEMAARLSPSPAADVTSRTTSLWRRAVGGRDVATA